MCIACPPSYEQPWACLPAAQGSKCEVSQLSCRCSRASTYHRSKRCSRSPPGGRQSGSGPRGSWGPASPHTDLGRILQKVNLRYWGQIPPGHEWASSLASCAALPARTQSSFPPPGAMSHSTTPGSLTTAVAGTAGILLEVGEESVARAAGGCQALTQSLVTHWTGCHKACYLEARNP